MPVDIRTDKYIYLFIYKFFNFFLTYNGEFTKSVLTLPLYSLIFQLCKSELYFQVQSTLTHAYIIYITQSAKVKPKSALAWSGENSACKVGPLSQICDLTTLQLGSAPFWFVVWFVFTLWKCGRCDVFACRRGDNIAPIKVCTHGCVRMCVLFAMLRWIVIKYIVYWACWAICLHCYVCFVFSIMGGC